MRDLRHDCSRYTPLLARASSSGVSIKCRDCRGVVVFPSTMLLPILLGQVPAVTVDAR